MPTVTNWFGNLVMNPSVVVEAKSIDDIVAVLKDPVKYPSPVRAMGSGHSTVPCGEADGGTLIKMASMNKILNISPDSITAQAGAIYIDLAQELEKHGLQFYVSTEIGSLSVGSAACAGTKDGSMPGEYGQVGSYVTAVRMILPTGEPMVVDESQPELLQKVRSSYGTFGIIVEATFRLHPIVPMQVHHETFSIDDFAKKLPELWARNQSMMYYIFPFQDLITVEFRSFNPGASGPPNRAAWALRNYFWGTVGPAFCRQVEAEMSDPAVRYDVIDGFCAMWRFKLENLIKSDNTVASDQIIRYPAAGGESSYTFSLWAFPEERYADILPRYVQFSKDYYKQHGYRSNMLSVGYRIFKDQQSLLSYSYDGNVMTVDPVSTGNPGWEQFLDAYNEVFSGLGGQPLLNQTAGVTPDQTRKALGDRWKAFCDARKTFDPGNRLLNGFFRDRLA
ncbi:MAG: FAD-binding protein [Terriglobia bacterium]